MMGERDGLFEAQTMLSALKHLSMREGYVLDYVYVNGKVAGSPILYARKAEAKPFKDQDELAAAYGVAWNVSSNDPEKRYWERYLDHVVVDGTDMGWLELVALHLMGTRFYLRWHAGHSDTVIVAHSRYLPALRKELSGVFGDSRRKDWFWRDMQIEMNMALRLAESIDFTPLVRVERDRVHVSVITFSKWGGFKERCFAISREPPHRIEEGETHPLVRYHCKMLF